MDLGYAHALGVAMYAFSGLEWNVIWCCERLQPNSIYKLAELTSGVVKKRFRKLATEVADDALRERLLQAADRFDPLVDLRNDFVHGRPMTDTDGGQRVSGQHGPWTIQRLEDTADEFTACSSVFNAFLHGALNELSLRTSLVQSGELEA